MSVCIYLVLNLSIIFILIKINLSVFISARITPMTLDTYLNQLSQRTLELEQLKP